MKISLSDDLVQPVDHSGKFLIRRFGDPPPKTVD